MTNAWTTASLGEVTRLDLNREVIDPSKTYAMVGVLSFARGLFDREPIENGNTSYRHFLRLKPDHIVMSQLFGWEGALALSSERFAGKYVSPQFPTFLSDEQRLDREFLGWLMRRPDFWSDLATRASGMGDRRRTLNPEAFFACQIPLPPVSEQRRIVARIQELAVKVDRAKDLRSTATNESKSLFSAACDNMLARAIASAPLRKLSSLVDPDRGISYGIVQTGSEFEGGVPTLRAGDLQWFHVNTSGVKRVDPTIEKGFLRTRLKGGELLLRIRGGVGELAVCPDSMGGGNVSREIAVIPLAAEVLPGFAMYLLSARSSQATMHGNVRGTSYVGINLKDVRELAIPVPAVPEQHEMLSELEDLKAKIDALGNFQSETEMEINAMLPAILDRAFKGEL
jgi:type I restriction enzyme S subunit